MRTPLKAPSPFPWCTAILTASWILGLSLVWVGSASKASKARPVALISPPAAVEDRVRQLAARVELLEKEVARLRSEPVSVRHASLVGGDR